jgi:hypothetical protein
MILARFTPATGWAGRAITYDGRFALEGYGPLTAEAVLVYDREGQIAWEYDGLREWVGEAAGAAGLPAVSADPAQRHSGQTKPPLLYGYAADARYFEVNKLPTPPGIAVAGFMLGVLGFIFPLLVWWWVGLALSVPGYKRAVREQLPTGLALAGLIINAVMTAVSVLLLLVAIVLVAAS